MLSYAIAFAVIGVVLHIVDIIVGKDWYRSFVNSCHKNPLPENVTRGFITGRSTKERLLTTLIITAVIAVLMYKLGDQKFLALLGDCIGIYVGLLVGFALGGFFKRRTNIEAATNKVLESLDKVDHGDLPDVGKIASSVAAGAEKLGHQAVEAVADQANKAVGAALDVTEKIRSAVKGSQEPPAPDVPASEPAGKQTAQEEDSAKPLPFSEAVKRFKEK